MDFETAAWIIGSGMTTAIGAPMLLAIRNPSDLLLDSLLGFTAGIMLAATFFSLLVPALELGHIVEIVAGLSAGYAVLFVVDHTLPHVHARFFERGHTPQTGRGEGSSAVLMLAAMTIHNIPEGLAVGVAFAAAGPELGVPIAIAIGLQNIPEGFAAGAPLVARSKRVWVPVTVAACTGIVEPIAAASAFLALDTSQMLLPGGLAFAAGAMLYVVIDELIPESHGHGNAQAASIALFVGFVLMLTLDVSL